MRKGGRSLACDWNTVSVLYSDWAAVLLLPSHWLTRKPPIQRSLQANQRRSGQKYSKWNCWNSGVRRISRRKAMSRSDSVSTRSSSSSATSSPMVTRNIRNTLRTNLFRSSTSPLAPPGPDDVLLLPPARRAALLPGPSSAPWPPLSGAAPASDSAPPSSSPAPRGVPLRWRPSAASVLPCSATGVGSTLFDGQ